MESAADIVQEAAEPTCIDCDHAYELPDDATTVACAAHDVLRDAMHPAQCAQYVPRQFPTASSVTEIWHEDRR